MLQDAATATEALRAALPTPPPKPVPLPPKPQGKVGKHGIRQLNMAQCTGIIDALKEGAAWPPRCSPARFPVPLRSNSHDPPLSPLPARAVYKAKVRPIEEAYKFGSFFSPLLTDADFDGKPQAREGGGCGGRAACLRSLGDGSRSAAGEGGAVEKTAHS